MAEVSGSIDVDASADAAWSLLREVGTLDQWMPMIEACEWDGESRTLTLAGGLGTLVEKVLSVDDDTRTLTYTITEGPFVADHHLATWIVVPDGEGCTVTWTVEAEPQETADLMGSTIPGTLKAVKQHLESAGASA